MIRFLHTEFLYLLALLPLIAGVYWWFVRLKKRDAGRFAAPGIFGRLAEEASTAKGVVKAIVFLLMLFFLIVGLADPQIGTRLEEVKQEGVDIFVALDVSLSMKAEDIKPNRLEKAKLELRNLVERLTGDRIGLVVFAGDAYTQFPLTTDYSAANLFLDVVDVDVAPVPGTAIGSAIERAEESFDPNEQTTKVIVIITDGENTEGDAFEAAQEAAGKGILLYTIGMGSPTGAPIPVYGSSGQQSDFKRDKTGTVVVSKLDEASLERIAEIGHGKYFLGTSNQNELEEIYKSINALQKKEFGVKQFTDYEDRFQWFLIPAIVLAIVEVLLSDRSAGWLRRLGLRQLDEEKAA